jgi:hypothetical protein
MGAFVAQNPPLGMGSLLRGVCPIAQVPGEGRAIRIRESHMGTMHGTAFPQLEVCFQVPAYQMHR